MKGTKKLCNDDLLFDYYGMLNRMFLIKFLCGDCTYIKKVAEKARVLRGFSRWVIEADAERR